MYNYKISVIVPIRITAFREDVFARLSFCYRQEAKNVEYIVVDDGSSKQDAMKLQQKCTELGFKYIATNASESSSFNLARVRNVGAHNASGKYIIFMDVDLLAYPGFYDDLYTEIFLQDLEHNSDKFLMIPVVYLNEDGLEKYNNTKVKLQKHFANQILLEGKFELIEKYSHGTSCILVDRLYYLSIGGQDEKYEGWGYEDYDFTIKMMRLAPLFPKPQNFESMAGNFMTIKNYSGWKAEYKLYGSYMGRKGIYLLHIQHEEDKKFKKNHDKNLQLLQKSLSSKLVHSSIKPILKEQEKSLLLSKNPFCYHYKLNAILGKYEIFDSSTIHNWKEVLKYFNDNNFTQIVFPNPYGNPIFLELYNYCRTHNIKYIVSERGALPGSVYHDPNGFLFDSNSYDTVHWNIPLTHQQEKQAKDYISELNNGKETLEKQPSRRCKDEILSKLDIDNNKKKALIVLQTKDDTVIRFFGREFSTQESLKLFLEKIISRGKGSFDFIYKNHPLEVSKLFLADAMNADNVHINDLISISDAVITVNSGAGLIAALLGKSVFTIGDSWYTLPGIACDVKHEDEFFTKVDTFSPSDDKLLKFAYYLRFKFYAFGKQHTVLHKKESTQINATLDIDYTEVQTQKYGRIYFKDSDNIIGFDSLLFKEFNATSLKMKKNTKDKTLRKNRKINKLLNNPKGFFKDAIINFIGRL